MRLAFGRRAWIVLALAVVSAVAAARLLDQPAPIAYYRVVDDRTIVVGADSGPGAWVRVTSVIETPAAVTISMSSFLFRPGPGTAEAVPYESTVTLGAALEN